MLFALPDAGHQLFEPGRRLRAAQLAAGRFSAAATISRAAFGVDVQLGFGAGNVVVADTIEIAMEIEFTGTGPDPR